MIGDLHCHTKLSDGSLGLEDVIYFSKRAGMDFVSITDHDTMAGVTRAVILGKRYGINVIPGIEFSAFDFSRGRRVHLLCYMPQKPDRLEGMCRKILDARTKAGLETIHRVARYYPITADFVARYSLGSKSIYKQHIVHALMDLGYTDRIFGDVWEQLFNHETGAARVEIEYPDVNEILDLIRLAGGYAVLAHPGEYNSFDLLTELLEQKRLDGIEVYHPRNTKEDRETLEQLSEHFHVMKFGGTDFHGFYTKKFMPFGTCITPQKTLEELFKQRKQEP